MRNFLPGDFPATVDAGAESRPSCDDPARNDCLDEVTLAFRGCEHSPPASLRLVEFEREMIRERTSAGLREARTKGHVPGRKPKITPEQKKEIAEAVSSGRKTSAQIARLFKIHPATVSRIVSQARTGG
jgi:DNA-binding CsgD family transcriptional regulator